MGIITNRCIYRPQRDSDLPSLHSFGLGETPAGYPLTVLDRKTHEVLGCVWREIIADENHHITSQRLSAIAASKSDEALFMRDVMRSLAPLLTQPWILPHGALAPQDISPETCTLASTAMSMYRASFPEGKPMQDGWCLAVSTGCDCQLLLRADTLCTGLALTAGVTPVQPMLPFGLIMRPLLTLRLCRFADSEEEIAAFITDAQAMFSPLRTADKKALTAARTARQKQFLQCVSDELLPLGFRRKGMRWVLPVTDGASIALGVTQHRFGDQLLFDLYAERNGKPVGIPLRLEQELDWQQLSADDVHDLMQLWIAEDFRSLTDQIQGE